MDEKEKTEKDKALEDIAIVMRKNGYVCLKVTVWSPAGSPVTFVSKLPQKVTHFLIPYFIGIKKGEITLVWEKYGNKEITKAVLSDGDIHDFELGFYIAYYKRVHKDWKPEVLRNKIIEIFKVYDSKLFMEIEDFDKLPVEELLRRIPKTWGEESKVKDYGIKSGLISYFNCIFYDNCGLDYETAKRFIKYITKRQDQPTILIPENFITKIEKEK